MLVTSSTKRAAAVMLLALAAVPWILPEFWTLNILARAFALGLVALSLTFLVSFCGMVSLCQMTIAGVAGYAVALFSVNSSGVGVALTWPVAVISGLLISTAFGAVVGWISYRSSEVYLLMLTLAIGVSTLFFVQQNMEIFNGFDGISGVALPAFISEASTRTQRMYWLTYGSAVAGLAAVIYLGNTPLGLTLMAMRDNPRRLYALGYNVKTYRIIAFSIAGAIAGVGGVLTTWYTAQVSPGTIDVSANVSILIMCVLGGQKRPFGAFLGALLYILLDVFSPELFSRERFNLLLGTTFLLILYFSPNGLMGLLSRWPRR